MPKPTRKEILTLVENTILRNRQDIYGPPEDSFATIADLWTVYLSKHKPGSLLSHDVAAMMALLKVARIMANPSFIDNWVDLTGYGACGGELAPLQEPKGMAVDGASISGVATAERPKDSPLNQSEAIAASKLAMQFRGTTLHCNWTAEQTGFMDFVILNAKDLVWADFVRIQNLSIE